MLHFGPCRRHDLFLVCAHCSEPDDDRAIESRLGVIIWAGVNRVPDLRQHPVGVNMSDEKRPSFSRSLCCKTVTIDEADAGINRVNFEACPDFVEKRNRRKNDALDFCMCPEKFDGALEDKW